MEKKQQIEQLKEITKKEISLSKICETLELNEYEVLGLLRELRQEGINIAVQKRDDDIYMLNHGERELNEDNNYQFHTNEDHEFKFVAISDTRFGSKSQQLSILNDIYSKAHELGYNNVILCGNISEGLYPLSKSSDSESNFLDDTLSQVDYITQYYPQVEGMKTYFITGTKDEKHLNKNQINIGRRISDVRDDMIYLGHSSCNVAIDKANMLLFSPKLAKTYTVSYRPQQQVDSFRSEDKPDILLYGGLLQMEKFTYRNVQCISVPSVCATTKEMNDKRYSNTIGAWYVTVKTDQKGNLKSVEAVDSVYYKTNKEDYKNITVLAQNKDYNIKKEVTDSYIDPYLGYINKMWKYIKNEQSIEDFMKKFNMNYSELQGILELCRIYGKNIDIVMQGDTAVFKKTIVKKGTMTKADMENLIHTQLCIVSDTHFGNIHQQLHLLNEIYQEAYNRGIGTVLHCGDMVDGNYPNRPEQPRQQFLHGFDEQAGYIVDMYPKIEGITTKYILGSHDETHYKNGQATINNWVSRCRPDMVYLGQDCAEIIINNIKIFMDHPGGGSAQSVSYKPQKRIEILESSCKPKILLIGHYHKSYSFVYRNVRGIEVPCFCDKTQFQQKQGLSNAVGSYFLDIWADSKGNIQYFEPEEILFNSKDMWDEAGKDRKKVKQLVIPA